MPGRNSVEGEPIRNRLSRSVISHLRAIGIFRDKMNALEDEKNQVLQNVMDECGCGREVAEKILEIRGDPRFGGTPPKERLVLRSRSPRIVSRNG